MRAVRSVVLALIVLMAAAFSAAAAEKTNLLPKYGFWGMGVIEADRGHTAESLKLFAEADRFIGTDIDFAADYAKALGFAGAETKNAALLKEAFSRFARVHDKAPQHTLNLQKWAITYFYVGNYAEAWKKIQLAEATPRRAELDQKFIADLRAKLPRP